ncbi:MAG TPA: methyltransferase domain-containing protein [Acidimicrobiia bacterium]|nr:methyltransferase domain-containing protein [Acidimicrobiia bacterium]
MREATVRSALRAALGPAFAVSRREVARFLDQRLGMQTEGEVELDDLGVAGADRGRYQPARWLTLVRILPRAGVGPDDVFIDFGSGKGRVVCQAARRYACRRVIGVELSADLNAVARANVDRQRHHFRCRDVELVTSDVLDYAIPDDVTIAFFNNPFTGAVFASVIDRLIASVDARPRPLRVIYAHRSEEPYLLGTGRFVAVRTARGLRPGRRWSDETAVRMYRCIPPP